MRQKDVYKRQHQGQVPGHRQDPAHGGALGLILGRAVPDPDEGVLGDVLGVLGIFQIGQGQAIHRCAGEAVQAGQMCIRDRTRAALRYRGSQQLGVSRTPSIPRAAAERKMAPTLAGSTIPSSTARRRA